MLVEKIKRKLSAIKKEPFQDDVGADKYEHATKAELLADEAKLKEEIRALQQECQDAVTPEYAMFEHSCLQSDLKKVQSILKERKQWEEAC